MTTNIQDLIAQASGSASSTTSVGDNQVIVDVNGPTSLTFKEDQTVYSFFSENAANLGINFSTIDAYMKKVNGSYVSISQNEKVVANTTYTLSFSLGSKG